jgi:hypothetical protein
VVVDSGRNCGAQEGLSISKEADSIGWALRLWLTVCAIPGLAGSSSLSRNAAILLHKALMLVFSIRSASLLEASLVLWRFPPRLPRRLVVPFEVGTKSKSHLGSVGECWSSASILKRFAVTSQDPSSDMTFKANVRVGVKSCSWGQVVKQYLAEVVLVSLTRQSEQRASFSGRARSENRVEVLS